MNMRNLVLTLSALGIAACSSHSKKSTTVKGDATPGYQTFSSDSFTLMPIKEVTLENGLKVIFIQDPSLPRISLTMLVRAGTLQDPSGLEGLNALTSYLLEQGTQKKSAMQLADDFGRLGTEVNITPGADFSIVFSDALSSSSGDLLGLFSDVVMNPAFADAEIGRMKSQMIAGLQRKIDNPSNYADDKMDEILFGKNAYAFDTNGTLESLKKMKKKDVIRHYLTYFRPNNASLAVVGNFNADFEAQIRTVFGKWTRKDIPTHPQESVPEIPSLQVTLLSKKNLQQTQIRLAQIGIRRDDPDFLKLRVANEILGGGFSSRLNQKVRDDLGLTYSIYSGFDSRAVSGSFEVSTFTKNDTVGKTLDETLKVVSDYVAQGVTDKELQAAKNLLIGQFPRAIETADKTAFNILALDFYGIPKTYLTDYNKNIEKITLSEVNEAIKKHISANKFKVLIYGDPKVASQLQAYKVESQAVK